MTGLRLYVLGSPRVEQDGDLVKLERRKNVALVTYLALTGQSHGRESLITLLWPDVDASRARANLRRNLSALRRALGGEVLTVDREAVGLTPGGIWSDVDEFRRLLRAWEKHGHPEREICAECLTALGDAAKLYRGDFLAGFTLRDSANFDNWQFFQTEGLRQELASALERLVRGHSARGNRDPAIGYARRWLTLDPMHELVHRRLMQLYAEAGQRAASLRQYAECERVLAEELGVAPEKETTRLYSTIREGRDRSPSDAPGPLPASEYKHNLPVQPTPFVGREAVLEVIGGRLRDSECRLLTLVGPGGSGKTRLALEAGAARLADFEDGVFFVSLAPLRSVESVVPTVAQAVGLELHGSSDPRERLLNYLRRRKLLLILDNFEHLLETVGLVSDIVRMAPSLKIVATSRARLNVRAEQIYPVGGMSYPNSAVSSDDALGYSALKLFLASAHRAEPAFELSDHNLADVVHICHLVEGMPLGIELAAAWVELLAPAEIAARVSGEGGTEIGQGLDFLGTDLSDVSERQRSMRAVFDHSWDLLTQRQQEVFRGLSTFRGSFTSQAAERIAAASLRDLKGLMDRSLLQRTEGGRFAMHSLLRQYAADRLRRTERLKQLLDKRESVGDRHCSYFMAALAQWEADRKGPRQQAALARMDLEIDDARAAWAWAVDGAQVKRLGRAIDGLAWWYRQRWRWQECEADCAAALRQLEPMVSQDETSPIRADTQGAGADAGSPDWESSAESLKAVAKIRLMQCWASAFLGHIGAEAAVRLLRASLSLLERAEILVQESGSNQVVDTRAERALTLSFLSYSVSDLQESRWLAEQAVAVYEELGDRWAMALALESAGMAALFRGAYEEARQRFEQSLSLFEALGDRWEAAWLTLDLGQVALHQGRLAEADNLLRQAITGHRGYQDPALNPTGCHWLAMSMLLSGEFVEAQAMATQVCTKTEDDYAAPLREGPASAHRILGCAELLLGQWERARASAEKSLALSGAAHGWGWLPAPLIMCCLKLAEAKRGVGVGVLPPSQVSSDARQVYHEAQRLALEVVADGRDLTDRGSVAATLGVLGAAERELGELVQAERHLCEALRISAETGAFMPPLFILPPAALLVADRGQSDLAVELHALASRYPFVANSRWHELVFGRQVEAIAESLAPEVVAAAQERGRARDMAATLAMLAEKLDYGYGPDCAV